MGYPSFGSYSDRGGVANEDYVSVSSSFGVLLDGASGLSRCHLFAKNNLTDAQWFSHTVGARISELMHADRTAREALEQAIAEARVALEEVVSRKDPTPDWLPSATLSVVEVSGDMLDVWWLGDSPIVVKGRFGIETLYDESLRMLDQRSIDTMLKRSRGRYVAGSEKRGLVLDVITANRRLRNHEQGYYILDSTGVGIEHLGHRRYSLNEVDAVAAFSDGMFAAFELYASADLEAFMNAPSCASMQRIVDRMRVVEALDPDFELYPRFKQGDDASAFFIDFAHPCEG